ncbi:hypothetical protein V1477_011871 [Vespula maculifrons]|uniref:Uncharacterized protein n=1 Tax=Vespula maculifrons TaxID=7453 RepID=A0ABD2C0F0_VESMC
MHPQDVASNLSAMTAIRTLESWCLTALVIQVSTQTTFMNERICTVWTLKTFPHCTRTIFPFDLLLLDMDILQRLNSNDGITSDRYSQLLKINVAGTYKSAHLT